MECNDPSKVKIINSLESTATKSFVKLSPERNFTEMSLEKSFLELFSKIYKKYCKILIVTYIQFYLNMESAELQLKEYKSIIQQYNTIIKQFNTKDKIQSRIVRDNINIITESSKSNNKLKNDQDKERQKTDETSSSEKSISMKSSSTESPYVMEYYNMIIKSFNIHIANINHNLTANISKVERNISNICKYNTDLKHFIAQYKLQIQIIRDIIPDITIESSESESKDIKKDIKKEIIDKTSSVLNPSLISTNDQIKNIKVEKCTANIHDNRSNSSAQLDNQTETTDDKDLMDTTELTSQSKFEKHVRQTSVISRFKSIIFSFLTLLQINIIIIIIKKFIPSKLIILIDKTRKVKKPEDIQVTKNENYRKYSPLCFTILILFLFISLFILYFNFVLPYINQNEKYTDIIVSDIVELEEEILDHDKTVRVLTEYLQRDIPLLKIVALVGGTNIDESYTVDIIKKRLQKRNNNDFSSLHPNFVALENLRAENSEFVINLVKMYQKVYDNKYFTILAVFKIEHIDYSTYSINMDRTVNIVKDTFIKANITSKIISFKPLSEDTLEEIIINSAKNTRQTFSREQINYYKRCLIEGNNCKKIYSS